MKSSMKKIILIICVIIGMSSCKTIQFGGSDSFYGQVNQTQVVLNGNNFRVLGSFTGNATSKKKLFNIKNRDGLVSEAKKEFLNNARAAGVELTGSRAIVNTSVDYMTNMDRITVTFSGEIIEFVK